MAMTEPDTGLNGAERFEEARARVREVFTTAIADIAERCLAEFVMPGDQVEVAKDAAKFAVFLMVLKMVEVRMVGLDWPSMLKEWRALEKELHREIPGMLIEFRNAHRSQQPGGTA